MTVKKRILALTTASLVLAGALTACGGQSATPEETGDSTTPVESTGGTEKVYHIVADNAFAPFEFLDEATGEYTGVDMDLLAAIAEDQGFQYTVDNCGWDAALGNLQAGLADGMIAGMSITDERRESYDFSDSYYDGGQIMIVKGDSTISSYEDLAGQTVAVKTATQSAAFAQSIAEEYGFEVVIYKDSPAVYAAVTGGIDAAGFAASFRRAVVDLLVEKLMLAAQDTGASQVALAGGVASNRLLRRMFFDEAQSRGLKAFAPPPALCTDNAAMIGSAAFYRLMRGEVAPLTLNAQPSVRLVEQTSPDATG